MNLFKSSLCDEGEGMHLLLLRNKDLQPCKQLCKALLGYGALYNKHTQVEVQCLKRKCSHG